MVTIAIEDNGIGIPKDALRKLGRPFEQVESQLTKRHQGSGLGLAIAKSLAELHGGAMRIRSTLGKGTIVVVRLPLEARPHGAPRNRKKPPRSARRVRAVARHGAVPKIRTKHAHLALGFLDMGLQGRQNPAGRRRGPGVRARRRSPSSDRTRRAGRAAEFA